MSMTIGAVAGGAGTCGSERPGDHGRHAACGSLWAEVRGPDPSACLPAQMYVLRCMQQRCQLQSILCDSHLLRGRGGGTRPAWLSLM